MSRSRNYDKELDLLTKLKHENKALKKELSRLVKELTKTNSRYEGLEDLVQQQYDEQYPDTGAQIAKEDQDNKWLCHKCKEDVLRIFVINRLDGVFYFRRCTCGNKTKLQRYTTNVKGIKPDDPVGKKTNK